MALFWHSIDSHCKQNVLPPLLCHTQHNALASVLHASQCNRPASSSINYKSNLLIELLNHYVNIAMLCTTCNERQLIEFHYLLHDHVIDQRHRSRGILRTNPAVRAGKVTSAPNTSIYGYINSNPTVLLGRLFL